jgi:hypothetical protein
MRVTVSDVIEAMRKNGFEQNFDGNYFRYNNEEKIIAACAYGQAAINLGCSPESLQNAFGSMVYIEIVQLNDASRLSVQAIADEAYAYAESHDILEASIFVNEQNYHAKLTSN